MYKELIEDLRWQAAYHRNDSETARAAADAIEKLQARLQQLVDAAADTIGELQASNRQVTETLRLSGFGSFDELLASYSQVKAERDAMFEDIRGYCHTCGRNKTDFPCHLKCYGHQRGSAWVWKGQKEADNE